MKIKAPFNISLDGRPTFPLKKNKRFTVWEYRMFRNIFYKWCWGYVPDYIGHDECGGFYSQELRVH